MTAAANPEAVVFPGQGTQHAGMGKDFHENFAEARRVFEEASDASHLDLAALCFDDDPRLDLTEFAQPAILTVEVAIARSAAAHFGFAPQFFGGHSLGEYSALVAADVLPLSEAVALVRERGRLMQAAVAPGHGAMTAVIKPNLDLLALAEVIGDLGVDVANHNSPDQVVLSGAAHDVERAGLRLKETEALRTARLIPLKVSAPFHSRLMKPIEDEFRGRLTDSSSRWRIEDAATVASNFTGTLHAAAGERVVDALVRQISATVRWLDNMRVLLDVAKTVVEMGPGRPLRGFFAALGVKIAAVTNIASTDAYFSR